MAAPDDEQMARFDLALDIPGAEHSPFELARVQLAYGERLRRNKDRTQAREQLITARNTFDRIGAAPWSRRADQELRATGLAVPSKDTVDAGALTAQQLEIARLAAAGMTNKEIGERLFLSPRTIGTHLYQVFPKLGITSRAALRDALKNLPETSSSTAHRTLRVPTGPSCGQCAERSVRERSVTDMDTWLDGRRDPDELDDSTFGLR